MKRLLLALVLVWLQAVGANLILIRSASAALLLIDGASGPYDPNGSYTGSIVFSNHYQQAYDNALFGSAPIQISSVEFRASSFPRAGATPWGSGTSYTLTIGIANGGVNALSSDFGSNLQSSQLFQTRSFSGAETPGGWFGFSGSYTYDPTLGDLIIYMYRNSGDLGGPSTEFTPLSGGEFSSVYNNGGTIVVAPNFGSTTRFDVTSAQVPEPATLSLLGLGLASLAITRRRKQAH